MKVTALQRKINRVAQRLHVAAKSRRLAECLHPSDEGPCFVRKNEVIMLFGRSTGCCLVGVPAVVRPEYRRLFDRSTRRLFGRSTGERF